MIILEDERINLIGKKSEHYIPKFNSLEQGKSGGWNWCGLLIGPLWFAYRKMYLEATVAFAVIYFLGVGISLLVRDTGNPDFATIGSTCCFAWAAFQGGMANKVYWWRISKLVKNLPPMAVNGEGENKGGKREAFIRRKGGVSMKAVLIAIALIIAIDITGFFL